MTAITPIECRICGATNLLGPGELAVPCAGCGLLVRAKGHTMAEIAAAIDNRPRS
jgi:hypothetical protein